VDQPEVHQHLSIGPQGRPEMREHALHQRVPVRDAAGRVVALVAVGRAGEEQRRAVIAHDAGDGGGVGAVAAEQAVLAEQPEVAGAGDGLARRIRRGIGGVFCRLRRHPRPAGCQEPARHRWQPPALGRLPASVSSPPRQQPLDLCAVEAGQRQVDVRPSLAASRPPQRSSASSQPAFSAMRLSARRSAAFCASVRPARTIVGTVVEAKGLRGQQPTVAGDDLAALVDQHWRDEAELEDAGRICATCSALCVRAFPA
jgi:hypothetical protein